MNKRQLYESIMQNVAKEVKKALNERYETLAQECIITRTRKNEDGSVEKYQVPSQAMVNILEEISKMLKEKQENIPDWERYKVALDQAIKFLQKTAY